MLVIKIRVWVGWKYLSSKLGQLNKRMLNIVCFWLADSIPASPTAVMSSKVPSKNSSAETNLPWRYWGIAISLWYLWSMWTGWSLATLGRLCMVGILTVFGNARTLHWFLRWRWQGRSLCSVCRLTKKSCCYLWITMVIRLVKMLFCWVLVYLILNWLTMCECFPSW